MSNSVSIIERLMLQAIEARKKSYSRYSNFAVGAALLTESGKVFLGCNIENLSFGLTMCAERVALGAAVQSGERCFSRIAIVADSELPIVPCGACRQVLAEFQPNLEIVSATLAGTTEEFSLSILLPKPGQGILG